MNYNKPSLSIPEQLTLLKRRGLEIDNRQIAEHYLQHISFYRLKAYTYPFQDSKTHQFIVPITFSEIIELYIFDRELRLLLMDAIERIEIAVRTQIISEFCMNHGLRWYTQESMFSKKDLFRKDYQSLKSDLKRSTETFIKRYQLKYTISSMPPAWMAFEVVSLSLLSKYYKNLKSNKAKKNVATHFGLGKPVVLESWLHSIYSIRNVVAHHGRLWNRVIGNQPMNPKVTHNTWLNNTDVPKNKLYFSLCCIQYLLKTVNPTNSFSKRLEDLLLKYFKIVNIHDGMGFPINWENEPLWSTENI